jgi:hypothetical protein
MFRDIYHFVDFHAKTETTRTKWRRIQLSEVSGLTQKFFNADVFHTVQMFRLSTKEVDEDCYCGLFFDFDSDELEKSRLDAVKVIDFMLTLGVPEKAIRLDFSGRRGFHVLIEPEIFGIKPASNLTQVIKTCCEAVAEQCQLSTFDGSVYSTYRMWRVRNSVNTKSQKRAYKIPLTISELRTLTPEAIAELARSPRELPAVDLSELTPELEWWWSTFLKKNDDFQTLTTLRPKVAPKFEGDIPDCVKDILSTGLKIPGMRNRACVILATYCKAGGLEFKVAQELLEKWVRAIPDTITKADEHERVSNVRAVLRTVYADDKDEKYVFACSYIRALGNSSNPVACGRSDCKYSMTETLEPRAIKLEDSTKACYEGVALTTTAQLAGKNFTPYIVPATVQFECHPPEMHRSDSPCPSCAMNKRGYKYELRIRPSDKDILNMIGVSTDIVLSILYRKARIKKGCRNFSMTIIDNQNVVDVMLVPAIRFTPENIGEERSYSLVQGYFVGHDVTTNMLYDIIAYLTAHPRQQFAVLLITEMKAKALSWQAQLPDEVYEKLKIFQTAGDPLDKFGEIWEDLEANVTHVYGRSLCEYAIDIVYHSTIAFFFSGKDDFVKRGWCELLIYGDTDTAKSTLAYAISTHYQLGGLVSCETTRRTGLTYSLQEALNGKWIVICGVLPLNDRGLVWLDEFREMEEETRHQLTQMRSEGVLQIAGVRQAILPCRVRLIFVAGPKRAMTMYDYGINSIFEVFKEREDIRRLDMVMIMGTSDVSPDIFYTKKNNVVEHKYTTELCNLLIRWVWNLKPEQIKFMPDAVERIFYHVKELSETFTEGIPVIKIEDLRYKLARIAASIAARTFNSHDGGKTLTIEARHADAAALFLTTIYSTKVCGLREKSQSELRRTRMENVNRDEARIKLHALIQHDEMKTFRDIMLENPTFGKADIMEMMGWIPQRTSEVLKELVRLRLVRRLKDYKGYAKTEPFVDILRSDEAEVARKEDVNTEEPELTEQEKADIADEEEQTPAGGQDDIPF